jgi:hypothetical protein
MPFVTGLVNRLSQGLETRIDDRRRERNQQKRFQARQEQKRQALPLELERQQAMFEQEQRQKDQALPGELERKKKMIEMEYDLKKALAEAEAKNVNPAVLEAFKAQDLEGMLANAVDEKDAEFVDRAYKMIFNHAQAMEEQKARQNLSKQKHRQRMELRGGAPLVDQVSGRAGPANRAAPTSRGDLSVAKKEKIKTINSDIRRTSKAISKDRAAINDINYQLDSLPGDLPPEEISRLRRQREMLLNEIDELELTLQELNSMRDVAAGSTKSFDLPKRPARATNRGSSRNSSRANVSEYGRKFTPERKRPSSSKAAPKGEEIMELLEKIRSELE